MAVGWSSSWSLHFASFDALLLEHDNLLAAVIFVSVRERDGDHLQIVTMLRTGFSGDPLVDDLVSGESGHQYESSLRNDPEQARIT